MLSILLHVLFNKIDIIHLHLESEIQSSKVRRMRLLTFFNTAMTWFGIPNSLWTFLTLKTEFEHFNSSLIQIWIYPIKKHYTILFFFFIYSEIITVVNFKILMLIWFGQHYVFFLWTYRVTCNLNHEFDLMESDNCNWLNIHLLHVGLINLRSNILKSWNLLYPEGYLLKQ